jgi:HD superfamily phosphohydrolase
MTVVYIHPTVLSTNEQLRAEVERLKTLVEINAEQARLNADTIGEQLRHYTERISTLSKEHRRQLEEKNTDIEMLKRGIMTVVLQRNAAEKKQRDFLEVLENAVIDDPRRPGELATLFYIYESGEYRARCRDCRCLECTVDGGCGAPCSQ